MKTVVVLGASRKPERYSNMLVRRLKAKGYRIYPVHPAHGEIEGIPAFPKLESVPGGADVISVYLRAERSAPLADALLGSGVPKIIFNPGAENPELERHLGERGVEVVEACSLVLAALGEL